VLIGIYLILQLVLLIPFVPLLWVIARMVQKRSAAVRAIAMIGCATLLFTPGWGPATITVVPVPFGFLFGIALFSFHWSELVDVLGLAPYRYWYEIAFPATALVIFVLRQAFLSRVSSTARGNVP
jgi:hypothetical protein